MENKYDFRILIMDDNLDIHGDFIKILTSKPVTSELDDLEGAIFGTNHPKKNVSVLLPNFLIDTATQGKEGVDKIKQAIQQGSPYSLAFVDVRMPPGWDGIETIKHIWEIDKDIQIVICTAYSDYSWEETVNELGQNDNLLILKKPFDSTSVRQLACALTKKWKLIQESRSYTHSLENTVQARTEELQHLATHDPLTALPNRILLNDRLMQTIADSERSHAIFSVLFFDLDRFKLINDSLSHAAGDELLMIISKRLREKVRTSDTLARIGGDEFVMIIKELENREQLIKIVSGLLETIRQPLNIANHNLTMTSSIGIATYPADGKTMDDLVRNADAAMYRSKSLGGNRFQFYEQVMNEESLKLLEVESQLRRAIIDNQLFLCYQPQYDVKENKLIAVEALVRWRHPEKGVILPIDFIPIAETTGLILPIGEWVLNEACKQNKAWQDAGFPPIRMAVNVTTQQLRQLNFIETVTHALEKSKMLPEYLELELSENSIINNVATVAVINTLKDIGVKIAVDDFGTGYSSLNYIRNLPLDRLKIDRSFIQNIKVNHGDDVIIKAIIAMAAGLNLEILAEGVETQSQLNFLKEEDCKEIQGFYFSQPLMANELEALFAKDKTKGEKITE